MSHRILIVEDEPNIVLSLEFLLSEAGHQVHTATSGEQALEEVADWHPDLVLLDVMLPGIDGFEVCRRLRTLERAPIVVLLTARGREAERVKGLDLGAALYVTKPFSTRDLLTSIDRLLTDRTAHG